MKKYIIITADTNDGDYITEKTKITDEQIEKYKPVIEAIKKSKASGYGHTWETGEMANSTLSEQYPDVDENLLENFNQHLPYGEYGVHSIESIEILEVANEYSLL